MINVYTRSRCGEENPFQRLKRTRWAEEYFIARGEWSQTPFHQGDVRFHVSRSSDHRTWALKEIGFPTRMVAVAETTPDEPLELIAAEMMRQAQLHGGSYIEIPELVGDIDQDLWWDAYTR